MADATSRRLVQLLQPEHPAELRQAAAVVLAELGAVDAATTQALLAALDDPDPALRPHVLRTVGKLRVERALPRLLTLVSAGGPEAELAAEAAAGLGARGTKALRELMEGALPNLRRRIAAALGAGDTTSAETAAVDALLDKDPGVVDAATRSLLAKVPALTAGHRKGLADRVLDLFRSRKKLPPVSEAALVRLVAGLSDARGEAAFWARVGPDHPAELRAAALQALGALPPPTGRDKLQRLFECAAARDFRVVAPALMILKGVATTERTWKDWLPLLDAPDPAARRFALERLQDKDTPEVAEALLRQLQQPDRSLQQEALEALSRLEAGRRALVQQLLAAGSPEAAWPLARAQARFAGDYAPELRAKLFGEACRQLDAGDRRADALLFLLREGNARDLRDRIEERAVALRKKKQYPAALVNFRLLTRDPACGEAVRFEAAACALKVSSHDLAAEARAADPALHQFASLLHSHETDPVTYVEKAKWLEPDDLFYLGFHFAEGGRPERELGRQVLEMVVQRSPRSKLAKDARSKLRSAGLE
jgi:HEAT repeat protein